MPRTRTHTHTHMQAAAHAHTFFFTQGKAHSTGALHGGRFSFDYPSKTWEILGNHTKTRHAKHTQLSNVSNSTKSLSCGPHITALLTHCSVCSHMTASLHCMTVTDNIATSHCLYTHTQTRRLPPHTHMPSRHPGFLLLARRGWLRLAPRSWALPQAIAVRPERAYLPFAFLSAPADVPLLPEAAPLAVCARLLLDSLSSFTSGALSS